MKRQVSLNNNSFDRAGITKDCKDGVCEYIWNGFEAGASKVSVALKGTPLQEAMALLISDNGTGIPYESFDDTFCAFLSSTKNNSTIRIKSQSNKGKGRFSYLAFSSEAEWTTVYETDGVLKKYTIKTDSCDRSQFDTTEPEIVANLAETGTTVIFPLSDANTTDQLAFVNMRQKLLEEFAWFLYLYKDKGYALEYMGYPLDISQYINTELSSSCIESVGDVTFNISVVVWKNNVSNSSKIYYRLIA